LANTGKILFKDIFFEKNYSELTIFKIVAIIIRIIEQKREAKLGIISLRLLFSVINSLK